MFSIFPVICVVGSVICGKLYFDALQNISTDAFWPILAYVGIFVSPVVALTLMALKEYSEKPEGKLDLEG